MSEFGGPDIFRPGEGGGGAPEELSEEAKQRFAAAAAGMKAIQREEKKSKKRDARVAKAILQFLQDDRFTHLFVLISRLVARDCPSIFILAILSLIDDECLTVVHEYLKEEGRQEPEPGELHLPITRGGGLSKEANHALVGWITRMQATLALSPEKVLSKLVVGDGNIDGTVLQLATFVLEEFFKSERGGKRSIPFEKLHPLTASILQTVFEPFLEMIEPLKIDERKNDEQD